MGTHSGIRLGDGLGPPSGSAFSRIQLCFNTSTSQGQVSRIFSAVFPMTALSRMFLERAPITSTFALISLVFCFHTSMVLSTPEQYITLKKGLFLQTGTANLYN